MLPGHLLVVEADPDLLNSVCRALRGAGLEVTGYTDPHEALAAVPLGLFDLLVADMETPGMGGAELLLAARALDWELAGVLMTARGTRDAEDEAAGAGAGELLRKPFRAEELFGAVERALGLSRGVLRPLALHE
jgi:DNA-binding NtrC family response regulator